MLGYTYAEVKKREMNLGLDLKGGMNVILEVSVKDVLKGVVAMHKTQLQMLLRARVRITT